MTALKVSIPWGLSNYIALNGFHPLYRALFEGDGVPDCRTWDPVILSSLLCNKRVWSELSGRREALRRKLGQEFDGDAPNPILHNDELRDLALGSLLSGDVEFLHTAPTPSLQKPFVFHFESFQHVFFPHHQPGAGPIRLTADLLRYYRTLFEHPFCLAIMSHLPDSLADFSSFFRSSTIDSKLCRTRMGLSERAYPVHSFDDLRARKKTGQFLFLNSANQSASNFRWRGGDVVLRFWKRHIEGGHEGRLILRCARPDPVLLIECGVDSGFVREQEGRSIFWFPEYLSVYEMNRLFVEAEVLLLPSIYLHSVSIMQALRAATIPIVTDTVGTDLYVRDGRNGFVLKGVREKVWDLDRQTSVHFDDCQKRDGVNDLDADLATLAAKLAHSADLKNDMAREAHQSGCKDFSGHSFSRDFWEKVTSAFAPHAASRSHASTKMRQAEIPVSTWIHAFGSPTQPLKRLDTGDHAVFELGGSLIAKRAGSSTASVHDWSVSMTRSDDTLFARDLTSFRGAFLPWSKPPTHDLLERLKERAKLVLRHVPAIYRLAAPLYLYVRRKLPRP